VHTIDCPVLAAADDADWVDLSWGEKTEGATGRISVEVKNEPGALGTIATIIGAQKANIVNLRLDNRDTGFHTNTIDVEVHDVQHLARVIAALRAADAVNDVERV
jgi:guanosine-3',5'-bis(diphosphate) 3'-pyrophosphohydrolase